MSRQKQKKFRENESRDNIIQPGKELYTKIKGHWNELYFPQHQEIVLELGCGRGEYTVGMAQHNGDRNFIGVDIKGDRIWKGSKRAVQLGLSNVAFLRTQIQLLEDFFDKDEVNEIWITFPDPRPKKRDVKRRLTHPRFLEIYGKIMQSGGRIHLKTDNDIFFEYTKDVLGSWPGVSHLQYTDNLYRSELVKGLFHITTHYEELFAAEGHTIKYLSFILN